MDTDNLSGLDKVVGLRQVTKGINRNQIKEVILATDVDNAFYQKVLSLTSAKNVKVTMHTKTKQQLAKLCGVDKIASVVGLLNNEANAK
jgi:ribosomal protein L7Ae-like RNA K-turn-binding protein